VVHPLLATVSLWAVIRKKSKWSPGPGVKILVPAAKMKAVSVLSLEVGRKTRKRHDDPDLILDVEIVEITIVSKNIRTRIEAKFDRVEDRRFSVISGADEAIHAR
jgi:hypothetical protein